MQIALRFTLVLAILAQVPAHAELVKLWPETKVVPGRYIIFDDAGQGLKALTRGQVLQEIPLENFPSGWLMRLSPEEAEELGEKGYTVTPDFLLELPREPLKAIQGPPLPSWHLDRDDQRHLPLDGIYQYTYTGKGVRAYVVDEGILQNPDFAGRLESAPDFVGDGGGPNASCGQPGTHGTFVADVLAGTQYGVAKDVTIIPLRIYRCDQTFWGPAFYAALDFVLSDLKAHPGSRGVVNMSFGGPGKVPATERFFKKLTQAGVVLVDAAANSSDDACLFYPAGSTYTITAGGTTRDDLRYSFSNYGRCVDLFAPIENLAGFAGPGDQVWFGSGTSLAAPQVVGHIAQLLEQFPGASPALVKRLLLANATPGVLENIGPGSPNLLLYTGAFKEEASSLSAQWSSRDKRLTVSLALQVPGGGFSPADSVGLFQGPAAADHCQGQLFKSVRLQNGAATAVVRGLKAPPGFVCAETSLGTALDLAVQTLN